VVEPDAENPSVVHVRLNRPTKLNAVDLAMFEAIRDTIRDLKSNATVRAVVLSGNGRAFCSGLDVPSLFNVSGLKTNPISTTKRLLERSVKDGGGMVAEDDGHAANLAQYVAYGWRELPVPVIAVVHGACYGAGLQMALGADVRIATGDAQLSVMEGKWGLIPDMSASITLRELVRIDVAKELTFTGRKVGGTEAAQLGLVTRSVNTHEQAVREAVELAHQVSDRSPDAVRLAKRLFQETWANSSDRECLELESNFQRKLLATWNQIAASSRNFGGKFPYF
jgi:enoyl-CoA hydratase/carnithine racemase